MNYLNVVWCFLALFVVCAYALRDNPAMVFLGMALFLWTVVALYYRRAPSR